MKNLTHQEIMEIYWSFKDEIARRDVFQSIQKNNLNNYDFYSIVPIVELSKNTHIILENSLLDIVKKSLYKTDLYCRLENKFNDDENFVLSNIESIIDNDFNYKYYYINHYQNPISEFKLKFNINNTTEKIMHNLILKSMIFSKEETLKTLNNIVKYPNGWNVFLNKELLHYGLTNNLLIKQDDLDNKVVKI